MEPGRPSSNVEHRPHGVDCMEVPQVRHQQWMGLCYRQCGHDVPSFHGAVIGKSSLTPGTTSAVADHCNLARLQHCTTEPVQRNTATIPVGRGSTSQFRGTHDPAGHGQPDPSQEIRLLTSAPMSAMPASIPAASKSAESIGPAPPLNSVVMSPRRSGETPPPVPRQGNRT